MNTIFKMEKKGSKSRLVIRGFKSSDEMHKFLNAQGDNKWQPCQDKNRYYQQGKPGPYETMTPGTYAYAGGQWHNVKSLDPSILAHI